MDVSENRAGLGYSKAERFAGVSIPWTLKDVLCVSTLVFVGTIILAATFGVSFGRPDVGTMFVLYFATLLRCGVPMLWIGHRYGCGAQAVGLTYGRLRPLYSWIVGIVAGVTYSVAVTLLLSPGQARGDSIQPLIPLSVVGFDLVVLGPICEEVMWRGFLYMYLRKVTGPSTALVCQAVLFGAAHLSGSHVITVSSIITYVMGGLLLGVLYEVTESLYAPIVCHGTINYVNVAFRSFLP
jgi:membrane protease YdiL (CAAX protease family)